MNEEIEQHPGAPTHKQLHAFELIFALGEDQITAEQFRELDSLVCNDPEIAKFYVEIMQLKSSLRRFASYFAVPLPPDPSGHNFNEAQSAVGISPVSMNESMVLPAISDADADSADDFCERFEPAPASLQNQNFSDGSRFPPVVKAGIAALVALAFGIILYVELSRRGAPGRPTAILPSVSNADSAASAAAPAVPVSVTPQPIPVATLNFTQTPVWSAAHPPPQDGKFLAAQSLGLESGDVQLSFQTGGRLVVEGPAEIEFVSDHRIALRRGKIVATVPGGGLVVDCPNGSVTDLGTQFGIEVHPHGATEVAVFQGHVSAALSSTATTQGSKSMLLGVGQAAVISPNALAIDDKGAMPQRFVRNLVNTDIHSLDVTDLIGGGDGTTHRRGIGIDPSTGAVGNLTPVFARNSDGKYHRTNGYPFIDGAFIADATVEAMIVDSAGDRFHFPGIGSTAYNYIFTGGKIPWPEKPEPDTVLNGIDYSTPDHSIICIHPNNAFTLDLNAVRRIYPDRVLRSFHCRVGISGTARPKAPKIPDAAAFVLIDGAPRFQNPHFTIFDGSFDVSVPIKETDRFMTLVSTYAGPGNYRNWVLWVDAKLDLSAGQ